MKPAILTLLLLTGCAHRVPASQPRTIIRSSWIAIERKPNSFLVFGKNESDMEIAIKELCLKSYLCATEEHVLEVSTVERIAK